LTDEIDDIYKEKDPIAVSLEKRKKAGAITTIVPDKNSKAGKYFFTLKSTGQPAIAEEAKESRGSGKS